MDRVLITGLYVFVRMATVVSSLPILGTLGVPRQAVLMASIAAATLIVPHLPAAEVPPSFGLFLVRLVLEMLYGLLLTLGVRVVFQGIALAGEMMGLQMGLALATLFDPLSRESSSALGTLATWLAAMTFFGVGLHLEVIEVVGRSFVASPPGAVTVDSTLMPYLVEAAGTHFTLGLQLAGPLICLVFIINVLMALLTRLAPRMNVFFALGLTATSASGMVLLWVAMPWFLTVHLEAVRQAVADLAEVVRQ